MSDTPRMDAALKAAQETYSESKLLYEGMRLELELFTANNRIKRLEEAGDVLTNDNYSMKNLRDWENAKQSKP